MKGGRSAAFGKERARRGVRDGVGSMREIQEPRQSGIHTLHEPDLYIASDILELVFVKCYDLKGVLRCLWGRSSTKPPREGPSPLQGLDVCSIKKPTSAGHHSRSM